VRQIMSNNSQSNIKKIVSNKLITLNNINYKDTESEIPIISVTDDIGESEGFKEYINTVAAGGGTRVELDQNLTGSRYVTYNPELLYHTFEINVKTSIRQNEVNLANKYSQLFKLQNASQSISDLIKTAISEGADSNPKSILQTYKSIYNECNKFLSEKYPMLGNMFREGIDPRILDNIINTLSNDTIITSINTNAGTQWSSGYKSQKRGNYLLINNKRFYDSDIIKDDSKLTFMIPTSGRLTSEFGTRNTVKADNFKRPNSTEFHNGIDIGCNVGNPIYAAAAGYITEKVEYPNSVGNGYGNHLKITHDNGFVTIYAHLSGFAENIEKRTYVTKGQIIAYSGGAKGAIGSGRSTGPHLHFSIFQNGSPKNPLDYLIPNFSINSTYSLQNVDKTITEQIEKFLLSVNNAIEKIIKRIYKDTIDSFIQNYVIDLTNKVTDITVHQMPGNSAKIKMQGENAPVVQSTGGKVKQATITIITNDIIDILGLASLFKVADKIDRQLSMLALTRSVFNAGDSKNRFKTIMDIYQKQEVLNAVSKIVDKKVYPFITSPLTIYNEFLNSLGIDTFVATSMEIQSMPDNPGSYQILLELNAINNKVYAAEILKKEKLGVDIPLLPLTARCKNDKKDTEYNIYRYLQSTSYISIEYCMTEFMPIYVVHKIKKLTEKLSQLESVDLKDVADLVYLESNKSVSEANKVLESIENLLSNNTMERDLTLSNIIENSGDILGLIGSIIIPIKIFNRISTFSGDINKLKGLFKDPTGTLKNHIDSNMYSYSALGIGSAIPLTLGAYTLATIGKDGDNYVNMNITNLIPLFMYNFIYDLFEAIEKNNVDQFIYDCCESYMDIAEYNNNASLPYLKIPVSATNGSIDIYGLRENNGKLSISGIKLFLQNNASLLTSLDNKCKVEIKELINNISSKVESNTTQIDASLVSAMMTIIQYWGIRIAKNVSTILVNPSGTNFTTDIMDKTFSYNVSKDINGFMELHNSATLILINQEYNDHVKECIFGLLSSTAIDRVISSLLINKYNDDTIVSNIYDNIDDKFNIVHEQLNYIEQLFRELKFKYPIDMPEIISGFIMSDNYPLDRLRLSVGYCGKFLTSLMARYFISDPKVLNSPNNLYSYSDIMKELDIDVFNMSHVFIKATILPIISALKEIINFIVVQVLEKACARLAIHLGIATASGAVLNIFSIFLYITSILMFIYDMFDMIVSLFLKETIKILITKGNLLKLSHTINNNNKAIITPDVLIDLSIRSMIWMYEILNTSVDIIDYNTNSYMDYPIVSFLGTGMPPDFWMYKIGYLTEYNNNILNLTDMVNNLYEEYSKDLSINDYNSLYSILKNIISDIDTNIIDNLAGNIFSIIKSGNLFRDDLLNIYRNDIVNHKDYDKAVRIIVEAMNLVEDYIKIISNNKIENYDVFYVKVYNANANLVCDSKQFNKDHKIESNCAMTINIYPDNCSITLNRYYMTVFKTIVSYLGTNNDITRLYASPNVNANTCKMISDLILNVIKTIVTKNTASKDLLATLKPDTLNNLMIARALVASYMGAVGKPGRDLYNRMIQEYTTDIAVNSGGFRNSVQYPALKLFFIEEDSEAYYLFDDLYNYKSIISCTIHSDITSPIQTAVIKITNILNNLSDITTELNPGYLLTDDKDGNSELNSILIKPGCKIKIQMGYTPFLTEADTVFVGRITDITPGEIMIINATSMGDTLMEEISYENIKIYGDSDKLNDMIQVIPSPWHVYSNLPVIGDDYMKPIEHLRSIISYVLTDATLKGKFDDYTIVPEMQVTIDPELTLATSEFYKTVKTSLFTDKMTILLQENGIDVTVKPNYTLFENINIGDSDIQDYDGILNYILCKGTAWISYNDTIWDILQDIKTLIPNTTLKTVPFKTRSSLVWGHNYGYYKYKYGSDIRTLNATRLCDFLRKIKLSTKDTFEYIIDRIQYLYTEYVKFYDKNIEDELTSLLTILVQIVVHANAICLAYLGSNKQSDEETYILQNIEFSINTADPNILDTVYKWLYISTEQSNFIDSLNILKSNYMVVKKTYKKILSDKSKSNEKTFPVINIVDVVSEVSINEKYKPANIAYTKTGHYGSKTSMVIKLIALEMAVEYYIDYIERLSASVSTSYRRIRSSHMKISGRDIVSNDIQLMEPYNTLRLIIPTDSDNAIRPEESDDRNEYLLPVHYKLDPRVMKVYSTYFRNVNVFPGAKHTVVSTHATSIMCNLLNQMYDGSITILGDSRIKEGDYIYIYDENTDMYGFIEAREVTHIMDTESGFLTVIKPGLITENKSAISRTTSSVWLGLVSTAKTILFAGCVLMGLSTLSDIAYKRFKLNKIKLDILKKNTANVENSPGKIREKLNKLKSKITNKTLYKKTKQIVIDTMDNRKALSTVEKLRQVSVKTEKGNISFYTYISKQALELKRITELNIKTYIKKLIQEIPLKENVKEQLSKVFDKETINKIYNNIVNEVFTVKNINHEQISEIVNNVLKSEIQKRIPADIDITATELITSIDNIKTKLSTEITNIDKSFTNLYRHINEYTPPKEVIAAVKGVPPAEVTSEARSFLNLLIYDSTSLTKQFQIAKLLKIGVWYLGGSAIMDTISEIGDLWLYNTLTSNAVSITPLFYRGNPFVAGLDGMDKIDGENAGLYDIIKTRVSAAWRGIGEALLDDTQEIINDVLIEYSNITDGLQEWQEQMQE